MEKQEIKPGDIVRVVAHSYESDNPDKLSIGSVHVVRENGLIGPDASWAPNVFHKVELVTPAAPAKHPDTVKLEELVAYLKTELVFLMGYLSLPDYGRGRETEVKAVLRKLEVPFTITPAQPAREAIPASVTFEEIAQ